MSALAKGQVTPQELVEGDTQQDISSVFLVLDLKSWQQNWCYFPHTFKVLNGLPYSDFF